MGGRWRALLALLAAVVADPALALQTECAGATTCEQQVVAGPRCMGAQLPWDPFRPPQAAAAANAVPLDAGPRDPVPNFGASQGAGFGRRRLQAVRKGRTSKRVPVGKGKSGGKKKSPIKYKMIDGNKATCHCTRAVGRRRGWPFSIYKWFNRDIYDVCMAAKRARGKPPATLSNDMIALRDCLKATNTDGSCYGLGDEAAVQRAAASLPSLRKLTKYPACVTVTRDGACTKWQGNKETEGQNVRSGNSISPRFTGQQEDLRVNQWQSCALVGRNPMIKLSPNGAAIDQHAAIWRFNLDTPTGSEAFVGHNTTVRVLNQGSANKADGKMSDWHPGERQRWVNDLEQNPRRTEKHWLLWNVRSNQHVDSLNRKYPPIAVRQSSSVFINWLLEVYFSIMADLEYIGIKPFNCADINSLPSGTHAIFQAAVTCKHVNYFGLSYTGAQVFDRAAHANYKWAPYLHHGWEFDGYIFRLMHLAGKASICTRDDKTVSTDDLLTRS